MHEEDPQSQSTSILHYFIPTKSMCVCAHFQLFFIFFFIFSSNQYQIGVGFQVSTLVGVGFEFWDRNQGQVSWPVSRLGPGVGFWEWDQVRVEFQDLRVGFRDCGCGSGLWQGMRSRNVNATPSLLPKLDHKPNFGPSLTPIQVSKANPEPIP